MTAPVDDEVHLSRDVALVLFEMLARATPTGAVRPADSADQRALWDLEAELERLLPEPFLPNYSELLEAARGRLRDPEPALPTPPKLVAFVDVDDTLVRSVGSKRIPIPTVVQRVRDLHSSGARLYCWSSGGSEYAHASSVELGIADCFVDFLAKPQLMVDDQPPAEWRNLVSLHPNEISSMTVTEIESVTSGRAG
ncbi:MAG TPA: hypothetical protein VHP33_26965 [Polyangiaceae bacterium]|nr:hypothetical protein [Polyangiaceae bacterium]